MSPKEKVVVCLCGSENIARRRDATVTYYELPSCQSCYRMHQIRTGSDQLRLDLRNLKSVNNQWVPSEKYDVHDIKMRVARTHYFNVITLGNTLANKMLEKAIGDYWNEVKGHWKFGSRPEWFSLPR